MGYGEVKSQEQSVSRKAYYEWMRCIACFLVIFNHLKGYVLFMDASGIKQIIYMIISVLTKVNVPLFFMVSGALLLEKEEDFLTVLKKRISRIGLVILLFEMGIYTECKLYALWQGRDYEFTVKRFFYGLFARKLDETGAYWYLYAYLGFLLMLPLLQKIAKKMSRQDFYALFMLRFTILSLLPVLNLCLGIAGNDSIVIAEEFSVPFASSAAFFYPLAGYYIDHRIAIQSWCRAQWMRFWTMVIAGIFISVLCVYCEGAVGETYLTLFDYLLAIAAFIVIKYAVTFKFPALSYGRIAKAVCFLGSLTFGIYLLDHYFKLVLYQRYETLVEIWLPSLFTSFGWCLISMLLGGTVTCILKKLPLLKKIL